MYVLKLWEAVRLFTVMACANLVFLPSKNWSNMRHLNQTQRDLMLRLLMPLNSLGFYCEIYNRNVQISTDLQRLNENVFIADRIPEIIAWRFKTNQLFWRSQKVNLIDCYCEQIPHVFTFSSLRLRNAYQSKLLWYCTFFPVDVSLQRNPLVNPFTDY